MISQRPILRSNLNHACMLRPSRIRSIRKQCTAIAVWSFRLKCHSGVIVRRSSAFEDVVGWVSLGTGMKQSIAFCFSFAGGLRPDPDLFEFCHG